MYYPYEAAKNNLFLAPLAGITDLAFREICLEQGAGLAFTEMVSAKGLQYKNHHTFALLETSPKEGKVGVQLFGREPETIAQTAAALEERAGDTIALFDINMGCPAPKIVNNGEGAALMREPVLAGRIISQVKKRVGLPVTVKFRKGFNQQEINAVDFARMAEDAGADAITVHGRTREQYYEGKADWEIIAKVKEAVGIPVNANGDVFTPEDAQQILEVTGADGVMIARGALGNPFLFSQILEYREHGSYREPTLEEKLALARKQAIRTIECKGEAVGIKELRKHAAWYIRGIHQAAQWRAKAVRVSSLKELEDLFCEILQA